MRGLRNKNKRDIFFKWCKRQRADLIFLQETYWTSEIEPIINSEWKGKVFYSHGSNRARGVAILVKENADISVNGTCADSSGRLLLLKSAKSNVNYCLINLYAPTEKKYKDAFFKKLQKQIVDAKKENAEYSFILGGDWNCVLDPRKDTKGSKSCYYRTPKRLKDLITRQNFVDVWRKLHKHEQQFTWRNLCLKIASRLDFWIISKDMMAKVVSTDIRPVLKGDHNAISLKLRLSDLSKGPGYWKLNTSLLTDENFKQEIKAIIEKCKNINEASEVMKWETLKIKCREFAQKYGKRKCHADERKVSLERNLTNLERQLDKQNCDKGMNIYE